MKISSLLVGSYHRPPAKYMLQELPSGLALQLVHEPENAHDGNALRVEVTTETLSRLPQDRLEALESALDGTGFTIEDLVASDEPIHLGYVAKTGGKPLRDAGLEFGNAEFLEALGEVDWPHQAVLATTPGGLWTVETEPKAATTEHFGSGQDERGGL